ncbi:MAG: amidohydrolase [Clostridia bacterium]|nr:amidohydrolase [Clostridia bacterium]
MEENVLREAKSLQKELVRYRRYLHAHAELGFAMTQTLPFVERALRGMGYTPQKCGKAGLLATVGRPSGKTVLLRADMDGLPIREETGLPFACKEGNMHACGHDMHTAMLLGGAKLLKDREKELNGCVKLLFQPAEEILEGAADVLKSGVLRAPKPQAAMMLHVMTGGKLPTGVAVVASGGVSAPAADYFTIGVRGKGCHGSTPHKGVDGLLAAAHIAIALQEISTRELPAAEPHALTIGSFKTGEGGNVICDYAELNGTLRAFDEEVRLFLKKRIAEVADCTAKAFRATAKTEFSGGCPTLVNDGELSDFTATTLQNLLGKDKAFSAAAFGDRKTEMGGSEDFAYISHKLPSVMVALGAGEKGEGHEYPLHHPKAKFDEGALCIGSAIYAQFAIEWLKRK